MKVMLCMIDLMILNHKSISLFRESMCRIHLEVLPRRVCFSLLLFCHSIVAVIVVVIVVVIVLVIVVVEHN